MGEPRCSGRPRPSREFRGVTNCSSRVSSAWSSVNLRLRAAAMGQRKGYGKCGTAVSCKGCGKRGKVTTPIRKQYPLKDILIVLIRLLMTGSVTRFPADL